MWEEVSGKEPGVKHHSVEGFINENQKEEDVEEEEGGRGGRYRIVARK